MHSLALRGDGSVVAWGDSRYGQAESPVWLANVIAIGAGHRHSLAALGDGAPRITVQPRSQSVAHGQTAVFRVMVVGQPPLQYAWSRNGFRLAGQDGPTLLVPDVNVTSVGEYVVTVNNSFGAVTSDVAWLDLAEPWLAAWWFSNGVFHVQARSLPEQGAVRLEATTNFLHWAPVVTNVEPGRVRVLADPRASDHRQRFYRVKVP